MFTVGMCFAGPPRFVQRFGVKVFVAQLAAAELRFFLDEMVLGHRLFLFAHGLGTLDSYRLL